MIFVSLAIRFLCRSITGSSGSCKTSVCVQKTMTTISVEKKNEIWQIHTISVVWRTANKTTTKNQQKKTQTKKMICCYLCYAVLGLLFFSPANFSNVAVALSGSLYILLLMDVVSLTSSQIIWIVKFVYWKYEIVVVRVNKSACFSSSSSAYALFFHYSCACTHKTTKSEEDAHVRTVHTR